MSRWLIERNGSGIEKSGTGVEKTGSGIEKSGTGIEKSGTGVEKSGTGISTGRRFGLMAAMAMSLAPMSLLAYEEALSPDFGTITIVASPRAVAVSWIFDGSVFSGVSSEVGAVSEIYLTEVGLAKPAEVYSPDVQVAGGGSGSSKLVAGGGSGNSTQVAGGGSGSATLIAGGGSGSSALVAGGGSGQSTVVAGGGSGAESIAITLPEGTGLRMEVAMGCNSATVTLLDSNSVEIAVFENQPVIGTAAAAYCADSGPMPGFSAPGFGNEPKFRSEWEMH